MYENISSTNRRPYLFTQARAHTKNDWRLLKGDHRFHKIDAIATTYYVDMFSVIGQYNQIGVTPLEYCRSSTELTERAHLDTSIIKCRFISFVQCKD
jgi:hypothetical protein